MSRRAFMMRGGTVLAAAGALPVAPLTLFANPQEEPGFSFSPWQEKVLSAVQEHLFPRGNGTPGAGDINALAYLRLVIAEPSFDAAARNTITDGIQNLHEASMGRYELPFDRLDSSRKESLLRYLADRTRWGNNWLSLLLTYLLEALLSDPVYGGNPGGIGWHWLQHRPGFPRPPAHKIFSRL